jgi:hypothetical protein
MSKLFWTGCGLLAVGALAWAQDYRGGPIVGEPPQPVALLERLELTSPFGGACAPTPCPPQRPKLEAPRDLPADARKLFEGFQEEAKLIRKKAEDDVAARGKSLADSLKMLQDQYTREAKLDEAVAIRELIRKLRAADLELRADPGTLSSYLSLMGQTLYFEVTGAASSGSIWGSEVYTYDSRLAVAAVHSGALKDGETGIVEVTLLKSPDPHVGSTANGVTSSSWGSYSASYTVKRWSGSAPAPGAVSAPGTAPAAAPRPGATPAPAGSAAPAAAPR